MCRKTKVTLSSGDHLRSKHASKQTNKQKQEERDGGKQEKLQCPNAQHKAEMDGE